MKANPSREFDRGVGGLRSASGQRNVTGSLVDEPARHREAEPAEPVAAVAEPEAPAAAPAAAVAEPEAPAAEPEAVAAADEEA